MKSVLRIAALALSCLALVSGSDRGFKPPASNSTSAAYEKFKKIKTAANFGKAGAKIEVCPNGDCAQGQVISLVLSRLEELNATGSVVSRAANLSTADGQWSELTTRDFGGVAAMTTTYNAILVVAKDDSTTLASPTFSITAAIYSANGTAQNGNQTVAVPAGGFKFTVSLEDWPFQNEANSLRFAVAVKARGKGKAPKELAKPQKKKQQLSNSGTKEEKIDRLDFGEGMFMDAPAIAILDGVDTDIKANADASGASVEYVWEFPSFKQTLYYDPVLSSTDTSAATTATTSTTENPAPTPSKSSALPLTLTGVAATTVAALALVFF